jgi:cell division protein FtsL
MAYQLETPQRKKQVKLPKMRRQKKTVIALDPVAIGGIVVAAAMLVLLLVGFIRLQNARAEVLQLQNHVSSLNHENSALRDTYASGYDLEEIEKIARAMGLVPVSEVTHVSVPVTIPYEEPEPTAWEAFSAFLTGLFA